MGEKVNIGCGMSPTHGWKNYDNSWSIKLAGNPVLLPVLRMLHMLKPTQLQYIEFAKSSDIVWADATIHVPLEDNSVDVLYSSHMLEHLDRAKAQSFLYEAIRVIRPGGIIRIVVPDLRLFINQYVEDGDANKFVSKLHMNKDMPISVLDKLKYLLAGDRHHQWNYDSDSLSRILKESGFENPTEIEAGSTTIPDPIGLNLREREEESLYVEATKPNTG